MLDFLGKTIFSGINTVLKKIEDTGKIETMDVVTIDAIAEWFQYQKRIHENSACGILIRYKAVLENKQIKNFLLNSMAENGYIQLMLDEQDMEIRNDNNDLVCRYFEADKEDTKLQSMFVEHDMIRFE